MNQHSILCLGGLNVDWIGQYPHNSFPVKSTPVTFTPIFGGAISNVAQHLASLNHSVSLLSAVGDDDIGLQAIKAMESFKIHSDFIVRLSQQKTASVIFVSSPVGKNLLEVANTKIYDAFTPSTIESMIPQISAFKTWLLDTDLSVATIEFLAQSKPDDTKLYAVIASSAKAVRIAGILNQLEGLFLNQEEASILTERTVTTLHDTQEAANWINQQGVANIFITMGIQGVCVHSSNFKGIVPAMVAKTSNTIGAGDAFAAGVIHGLQHEKSIEESVDQGLIAANVKIQSSGQVYGQLSIEQLNHESPKNARFSFPLTANL